MRPVTAITVNIKHTTRKSTLDARIQAHYIHLPNLPSRETFFPFLLATLTRYGGADRTLRIEGKSVLTTYVRTTRYYILSLLQRMKMAN